MTDPTSDVPVGSPFLEPGATLRCVRELFLLMDEQGRTWLAVGEDGGPRPGGVMPHLLPGAQVRVVSTNPEGLVVRVPREEAETEAGLAAFDADLPAYLIPAPLLSVSGSAVTGRPSDSRS